jgi:arylsulfatase
VADGRLERTVPIKLSIGEGLDIGMDGGSAVDFVYPLPFAFEGAIETVTIELKPKPTDMKPAEEKESVAAHS